MCGDNPGMPGERFNTTVTVTCAVGLVIVLQRLRALQRQVDTLAELARGHETSLQWLTQRMETPVIRVGFLRPTLLRPAFRPGRPLTRPGCGRCPEIRSQARGCPCRHR